MGEVSEHYKPAVRFTTLNALYDRFALWAFRKTSFGKAVGEVLRQLQLEEGLQLLELGCGPARLAIRIQKKVAGCHLTALDGDPKILTLARRNVQEADVPVQLICQDMTRFSFKKRFDRIYSTFAFHHVSVQGKERVLERIAKSLKKGGRFVLADFCQTSGILDRLKFTSVELIDGFDTTESHAHGWLEQNLPKFFKKVRKTNRIPSFLGPLGIFVGQI